MRVAVSYSKADLILGNNLVYHIGRSILNSRTKTDLRKVKIVGYWPYPELVLLKLHVNVNQSIQTGCRLRKSYKVSNVIGASYDYYLGRFKSQISSG